MQRLQARYPIGSTHQLTQGMTTHTVQIVAWQRYAGTQIDHTLPGYRYEAVMRYLPRPDWSTTGMTRAFPRDLH